MRFVSPNAHLIAVLAFLASLFVVFALPARNSVGSYTFYDPCWLIALAATALVTVWAGITSLRRRGPHRLLISGLILPCAALLFLGTVCLIVRQYHPKNQSTPWYQAW